MTYTTADGRVSHKRDAVLGSRLGDTVLKDVSNKETQLNLDGDNLSVLDGLVDGRGGDLAEGNTADQAAIDVLLDGLEGDLHRNVRIPTGALEDINLLTAVELLQARVDGAADLLGRAAGGHARGPAGALDAEHDLVGILGVLGKVLLEQDERVVLGRAVELAGVPEVAPALEGRLHCLEGLLGWGGVGAPGEA